MLCLFRGWGEREVLRVRAPVLKRITGPYPFSRFHVFLCDLTCHVRTCSDTSSYHDSDLIKARYTQLFDMNLQNHGPSKLFLTQLVSDSSLQ